MVRPLGAGAFGQVHLAWDTIDHRFVALKRFTGQDELGLLRFVIESRIRVEHPHLVRTLAFRLVDDRAWLVTELARGGSVRQLMDRAGPLPVGWVVEAIDHLLDALTALHATGVVHRDLKPANLLLRDGGGDDGQAAPHLLVGDFGIATWRTVSMTGIGAAIGTPGYLAPEYLDGTAPSPVTDLFAVGVLAAELLAGRRLIHYSNSSQDIPADWTTLLPLPDEVPTGLAAVLRRMADPDVRRRYQDCTQAREALLGAAPPGARGDLTAVPLPDLLAGLPAGWTPDGPTEIPPDSKESAPPTVVVQEPTVAVLPEPVTVAAPPPSPPATARPTAVPWHPPTQSTKDKKRRGRRVVAILVLLIVFGAAATVWWAAENHTVDGTATSGTGRIDADGDPDTPATQWTPVEVEPCSRADLGQEREQDGERQRCQRSQSQGAGQYWVLEPPGGFPKSDPSGPFPGEECPGESDTSYSPVGAQLQCQDGTWRLRS